MTVQNLSSNLRFFVETCCVLAGASHRAPMLSRRQQLLSFASRKVFIRLDETRKISRLRSALFRTRLRAARAAGIVGAEVFTGTMLKGRVLPMNKKAWR